MKKFIQRVVVGLIGSGALAVAASAAELRFNNPA